MLQSLLPIAGLLGPFHHPSCPSPPHSLSSYSMLNPLAPPFVYGGTCSEAAASFDMGHSFFSYPSLPSSCAPSSTVFPCSAGNGWNEKHYYHHHFHFFADGMTPSTISYYSCFPTQLPPLPPQLHPFFPFHYQPTKLKLEEIDGPADGSEEHQLVMTKKEPQIVHFYPCKDEKIPCFVRRKRGGGKRFVTACWEQNAGSRVHPAPRKSSELKHDGAGSRVRRGHTAVGAWVPKAKLPVEVEGAKPEEVKLDVEDGNAEKTTLMIKNIPNRFNRGNLISILDGLCKREDGTEEEAAAGAYDFLYLPIDFQNRCNLGYAFVNFTTSGAALWVSKQLHKHEWKTFSSKKICEITYARLQGKKSLVDRFKNSVFPCDSDDYLPVVFCPPRDGSASCPEPKLVGKRRVSP